MSLSTSVGQEWIVRPSITHLHPKESELEKGVPDWYSKPSFDVLSMLQGELDLIYLMPFVVTH